MYRLADKIADTVTGDDLLKQLLHTRGITDSEDIEKFIDPDYESGRHDPFLMHDMEKAVLRVLQAINDQERIAIYSDYDSDGIPGAVVLHDFFKAIDFGNFQNYIPHRHYEGFGLSSDAVVKLNSEGVKLIITIDCGTSDIEAVSKAKELGIDVIITDHHEPKEQLPEAVAIVNPKIGDTYPFKELCGAGVVFKLVEALIKRGEFQLKEGFEKWWLDMVGLATISDMVPLVGENRVFAHYGLQVLRKSRRPGLQQLLRKARASQRYLNEDDIGFTIAPRINAASRMDDPEDAFLMLASSDESEAGSRVDHLERLNNERKGIVAAMTKELKRRVEEMADMPPVLVLGNPEWRPALVGLAANSLSREFKRPAFLWGRDGNGVIKGSCRSEGTTSVVRLMEAIADHFLEHGGHHASGGFSVKEESIYSLPKALNDAYGSLGQEVLVAEPLLVDAELRLDDVNGELLKTLRVLSPYGVGNAKPLFAFNNVVPTKVDVFGKNKEHMKLLFDTGTGSLEAVAFFASPEQYKKRPEAGMTTTLLAHVEESFFMNRRQTRLRIVDLI